MQTSPQLESYLSALDKALGPIATSERAEIVTEIKSHVVDAQERGGQNLEAVLASLGEPEQVANRYLIERGLKPAKTSKRSVVKWLVIGGLGMFGLSCFFVLALIWHFSPLISVDEKSDQVKLLGGMVDVNGDQVKIKVGGMTFDGDDEGQGGKFMGAQSVPQGSKVNLNFNSGKFRITGSNDRMLKWDCKAAPIINTPERGVQGSYDFNFTHAKCDVVVPAGVSVTASGTNGKIDVEKLKSNLSVRLANGSIGFRPDSSVKYKYSFDVLNGARDNFESSDDPGAYKIEISMTNGKIAKL
jgi:hypothetical protein